MTCDVRGCPVRLGLTTTHRHPDDAPPPGAAVVELEAPTPTATARSGVLSAGAVVAYTRVSTEEQGESGAGLEAQREAIGRAATARGWTIARWHSDIMSSGCPLGTRPGIQAALRDVEMVRGTLIVSRLDRLSRSVVEFAGLMDRAKKAGWSLVALDLGVDTTTPAGEMVANVMASFAQYERRLIGARTREGLAAKRAAGVRLGRRPSIPDDVRARIHQLRAEGLGPDRIAQRLNADGVPTSRGGKKWWPATIQKVLAAERVAS